MYPTHEEYRKTTHDFLLENHADYLNQFNEKKWNIIYERDFYKPVSQHKLLICKVIF